MKNIIPAVKGTRDFYPEQMAIRNWLYSSVRRVSESFGYQEWDAPFLETLDLYAAKSGEELVKKQSYVFTDRGGDEITLRPELTPSLARMVAARQNELVFPLRWWSFGPFWRYERPGRGRSREFFQWNIDLIGVDSPEADAELIAIAASFFRAVGLSPAQVQIGVNNRRFLDAEFKLLGISDNKKAEISALVDRRDKMEPDEWEANAVEVGLTSSQVDGLKALLTDRERWCKSDELVRLFGALDSLEVKEYVRYDPNIVRGLLYYTGTVFEAFDVSGGVRRAIFGGGRYDNLLQEVGAEPLSAVGFAMGDVVISLLLQDLALIPTLPIGTADVLVTVFSPELLTMSLKLASEVRKSGFNVTCYPEPAKLPRQFKFADRMGMKIVLVIGPDEIDNGNVTLKNLRDGSQTTIKQEEIQVAIRSILESG